MKVSCVDSLRSMAATPAGLLQVNPCSNRPKSITLIAVPSVAAMQPRRPVLKEMNRRSFSVSTTSAPSSAAMCRSGRKRSGSSQTLGLRPSPVRLRMTWLPLGTR
ncbi:hypothetical protein GUJ93_ZPchr0003g18417 [Zizania palustris]|uniref:Uncharacterized protein n=1 Tax=Zizania palustris TaxID=103762 RepID=A0A8J5VJN7_ZIZPA|nr:hypothetical protein GUJ93_ZPchr0003g18417 [Zizania palustris]